MQDGIAVAQRVTVGAGLEGGRAGDGVPALHQNLIFLYLSPLDATQAVERVDEQLKLAVMGAEYGRALRASFSLGWFDHV